MVEAQFETTKDMKEVQAHLDQNVLVRYAPVASASILDPSGWPLFGGRTARLAPPPLFGANLALENRD